MKINPIISNHNNTSFKASFEYRVFDDKDNLPYKYSDRKRGNIYAEAVRKNPQEAKKIKKFLDYMASDQGIKKLSNLPGSDDLSLEILITSDTEDDSAPDFKLKMVPWISYSINYTGDPDRTRVSNYFFDNGDKFGEMAMENPSKLLDYIADVRAGKLDIEA